ncbi:MAG TPA: TIM barrel protein [Haliscomenobacter sp.]|uniref:Xylose isomerase domain-containing protein TIM barrel n=1 Tax=Haliscomenobacter hydrossis (strain ATCC 27775 / DSM 1100 / LMG 10767 / O) TaxID=760192 RepID=F4L3K8_HALH1|nr:MULTISPECIES: TIM barrel protein [Haliscomenobacter]AEE53958.1 Xylose isomerase domain-containing protein TIM barrel [Haliscomenobacter hydrossis DSM 1100]HOY21485.1 TIM barrel protein [Haliscomenobacter sp.]
MQRRKFVQSALAASAAIMSTATVTAAASPTNLLTPKRQFKMRYAPHLGMFENSAGKDPIDQLKFMADQGFTALEDNGMTGRDVALQTKMGETLAKLDMQMGVFVAHKIYWTEPSLTSGKQDKRDEFLQQIKNSVEVAKRVNATWVTVVPGYLDFRQDMGYQTANVVESLKQACDILEPHKLIMVLEPLNFRDHPGLFLTKSAQGYEVCKAVDSPSCKILFDIYHQQITEGNLIPNIDRAWDEIAYFQIGDNPGRKEPTTGEINYKNVFKHIHGKGFTGVMGMEHGNAKPGKDGEMALIKAYEESDNF